MAGIEAQDQPIEKTPAAAAALDEQPIHLRRQPDQMDQARRAPPGSWPWRRRCGRGGARRWRSPRRGRCRSAPRRAGSAAGRRSPRRRAASGRSRRRHAAVDLAEPGAAQAAAGREKGNCLQEIGLARAIGAGQHHGAVIELEPGRAIAAEIGEDEARHGRPRRRTLRSLTYISHDLGPPPARYVDRPSSNRCARHTRIGMRT